MSSQESQPTEAEMRAALEEEVRRVRVQDMLLQSVASLLNLGIRRAGLADPEDDRDPEQVRLAIESVRALTPVLEQAVPEQAVPVRDALSQLQVAYVRQQGGAAPGTEDPGAAAPGAGPAGSGDAQEREPQSAEEPRPGTPPDQGPGQGQPGPAQSSGRLWVPGR